MMKNNPNQRMRQRQRSSLIRLIVAGNGFFHIKWAETREELGDAFRLVYDEYKRSGYISEEKPGNMFFYIHHLLPDTAVLLMRYKEKVISTLSLVPDSKEFGLPMDSIYREELDVLRRVDRHLMEACALATSENYRSPNIFANLFRQSYWHAVYSGIDAICIMVNPKHVQFYKRILLFDELGVEKNYPRVGAPAVALRLNVKEYKEKLKSIYGGYPADANLYRFVFQNEELSPKAGKILFDIDGCNGVGETVTRYFYKALSQEQKEEFTQKLSRSRNFKILSNIHS